MDLTARFIILQLHNPEREDFSVIQKLCSTGYCALKLLNVWSGRSPVFLPIDHRGSNTTNGILLINYPDTHFSLIRLIHNILHLV